MLVLPTGETIRFEETSQDVIHSFWVPELLFKRDVFPGNVRNVFEVTSLDTEGAYVGRCAELCGTLPRVHELRAACRSRRRSTSSSWRPSRAASPRQEALTAIGEDAVRDDHPAVRHTADAEQLQPGRRAGRRGKLRAAA